MLKKPKTPKQKAPKQHTLFSKINSYALTYTVLSVLLLGIIRFSILFLFGNMAEIQSHFSSLDNLLIVGLRFDLRVVGTVLILFVYLPYLLFFWLKKPYQNLLLLWIKLALSFFLILTILLAFTDIGYFQFFGTPIDILIFGLLEDDTQAVMESAITDPSLLLLFFLALITTVLFLVIFLKWSKSLVNKAPSSLFPTRAWFLIFLFPILLVIARGSVGTFPLSLKQSSISNNSFINSLTQNAVFHLKYASDNHKENNLNKSSKKILAEAKVKDINELKQKAGFDASHPLIRKTKTHLAQGVKPPHVIFVQMEGWSSHIALNDSKDFPVLGSFKKHAQQDYFLPYFFANRNGTNPTIENILLNSPLTPLSQSSGYKTPFSTSNVRPFKKNKYATLFLSGGYSSWRNHDIFWAKQGFDQYIGRTVIENKLNVDAQNNPWGTYDEYVFKYLEDYLSKQNAPSFTYVLTTNNHPPVRLPPDYHPPEFKLETLGIHDNLEHKKNLAAAYRYQTNALGDFLTWLKNSPLKDNVIVVATGDHPLRGFDDYTSLERQFLRFAVPAYFYIPEQYNPFKQKPKKLINSLFGSHADLFPTLFELALPETDYYAFGTPIMQKTPENAYGWNFKHTFLLKEGVIDSTTNKLYLWSKQNPVLLNPQGKEPNNKQLKILEQENYRRLLKEWLLYKDKERESK